MSPDQPRRPVTSGQRRHYGDSVATAGEKLVQTLVVLLLGFLAVFSPSALGSIPQRALFFGLTVAAAGALALVCALAVWLYPRWQQFNRPTAALILLFCGYVVAWMLWSPVPASSRLMVMLLLAVATTFLATVSLVRHKWQQRSLVLLLIVTGAAIATYGLVQYINGRNTVWGLTRAEQYFGRAGGTFGCPNHFSGLLEMILPFALAVAFVADWGWTAKIVSCYAVVVMLAGIVFSLSRGGWLSTIGAIFVFSLLVAQSRAARFRIGLLVALGLFVGAVLAWSQSEKVRSRLEESSLDNESFATRVWMWESAAKAFADRPLLGWGPYTFHWTHARYRNPKLQRGPLHVHNDYLQLACDYGIVGIVLFGAALAGVWSLLVHSYRRSGTLSERAMIIAAMTALAAHQAHSAVDFNMHIPSNAIILLMLVGLALSRAREVRVVSLVRLSAGRKAAITALGLAVFLLTSLSAWRGWRASLLLAEGLRLSESLEWESAERSLTDAWAYDPQDYKVATALGDLYRVQATWALEPQRREEMAKASLGWYGEARRRNPLESDILVKQAELLSWSDRGAEAESFYRQALDIDPQSAFLLVQYGIYLRKQQRFAESLVLFRRALKISPGDDAAKLNIAAIGKELGASGEDAPAGPDAVPLRQ